MKNLKTEIYEMRNFLLLWITQAFSGHAYDMFVRALCAAQYFRGSAQRQVE